ncbi:MAG: type II toxin-antitoxin system VapC family toxin [Thermodesulfovibrionales bacterium]
MKALLDTHVFLWWILDDPRLPRFVRRIISEGSNALYFSAASCWEIAIKARLGKLTLPGRADQIIAEQMAANEIEGLPVQASHALYVFTLPEIHRDPFDRMLIAQSHLEMLPLITSDPLIARYKVKTIWEQER